MFHFGCKFVKFFARLPNFKAKFTLSPKVRQVELPSIYCKISHSSLKIIPFFYPKTKFKHTLKMIDFEPF